MKAKAWRVWSVGAALSALLAVACGAAGHAQPAAVEPFGANRADVAGMSAAKFSGINQTALEISWIPIPAGIFSMGCSVGDTACKNDERPRHALLISDFYMTTTKITQAQYAPVVGHNPAYFQTKFGWAACPNCPVETVTWRDADAFCRAIGGRLPTEAEWEYAARASSDDAFVCGRNSDCLGDEAWDLNNSDQQIHPVAQKRMNFFDLYDMAGDAYEWTADWYGALYYLVPQLLDPAGPAAGKYRVVRGGSWATPADELRVSARFAVDPEEEAHIIGFRCVYR